MTLGPVALHCPVCRVPLASHGDILRCPDCPREYPIIDGIPVLLPDVRSYVAAHLPEIVQRDDLPAPIESLLGDCAGPGSAFDTTRLYLSSYAWDHYGDLDPAEESHTPAGSVVSVLTRVLDLLGDLPAGPILDAGCSVGRTTFEISERTGRPTLGVDVNFAMLRMAARVACEGRVVYPRRRLGVVYDRREFPACFAARDDVRFWAADVTAPPFAEETFAAVVGLHVIDSVASPLHLIETLPSVLQPGGKVALVAPYDWSAAATPIEGWLGGHSQRSDDEGAAEPRLRQCLDAAGLDVIVEDEVPWRVRLHERGVTEYRCHVVVAQRPRD